MTGKSDVGALVITIEEEGQGLEELEALLTAQSGLLVAGAQRPLLENLSQQEKVLRRLGKLEEQRLRLLEDLGADGRLAAPPTRLDDLALALPEPERSQVAELSTTIGDRARDIRRLERRNRVLIESGRRSLEGFLKLLVAPREQLTYGNTGPDLSEPRFFSSAA